jgi:Domain of unknown function (DUF4111)/Nucleotidyltransferase domain
MLTDVRTIAQEHLLLLDEHVPGLVTALLIAGSIALGDYRPGVSDIDFVAVMESEPTPNQLVALPKVHEHLPAAPSYDGIYLTRKQLATTPATGDTAPQILAGEFRAAKPGGQLHPVTWLELASAIPVHGERPVVPLDEDELRRWLCDNLTGYWAGCAASARRMLTGQTREAPVPSQLITWCVLGPGRLHYTLATGKVTSKTAAGKYTAEHFPAWRDLCERAVRARAGTEIQFTAADGMAAADLVDAVVTDAINRQPQ